MVMRAWKSGLIVAGFATTLLTAAPASAQQAVDDKYWLEVSGFLAKVDTDIRLASVSTPSNASDIDLEKDLGFDKSSFLPAFRAGARVGSGFSLEAEYYALGRDTSATLSRDITVEDVVYRANANVKAGFDTDVYRFTVGWAFARKKNWEVGAALGVHATNLGITFEGNGTIGTSAAQIQKRREQVLAPLPTVGVFGSVEVIPHLTLGGRIDYLSLSIDKYDGRLFNGELSLAYRFTRNFGAGVKYRYVDYRVDVKGKDYTGRFAYNFSGPSFFLVAGF
jgi:hypothetical protein